MEERWFSESNFGMLQVNDNFDTLAVSAMSNSLSKDILRGWPFGGIAIM